MTSASPTPAWNLGSHPSVDADRAFLLAAMQHSRALTLALFTDISEAQFTALGHGDFSPVGWHLGHIGYTESLWILEKLAGQPGVDPASRRLYAADGLPKSDRADILPDRATILAQLAAIRSPVETVIAQTDLQQHPRLGPFLLQHESQHCETVAIVLAALGDYPILATPPHPPADPSPMIHIPAGGFWQGDDHAAALDNEQPRHWVELPAYWIDATPVTGAQYQPFIQAGGYCQPKWWSDAGWAWLQTAQITQPEYWPPALADSSHPVSGVSWYEAEAYARFSGKRLPTEAEWEKAARWNGSTSQIYPWGDQWPNGPAPANLSGLGPTLRPGTTPVQQFPSGRSAAGLWDCVGNVWEWTDSWFAGYPGFAAFPYRGYSEVYFDRAHRVLRGGSWATRPWSIRASFRNWYHPGSRVIFAGFRCARNG